MRRGEEISGIRMHDVKFTKINKRFFFNKEVPIRKKNYIQIHEEFGYYFVTHARVILEEGTSVEKLTAFIKLA